MMRFRMSECADYKPPDCPVCGTATEPEWVDVTCWADGDDRYYMPVREACPKGCDPKTVEQVIRERIAADITRALEPYLCAAGEDCPGCSYCTVVGDYQRGMRVARSIVLNGFPTGDEKTYVENETSPVQEGQ